MITKKDKKVYDFFEEVFWIKPQAKDSIPDYNIEIDGVDVLSFYNHEIINICGIPLERVYAGAFVGGICTAGQIEMSWEQDELVITDDKKTRGCLIFPKHCVTFLDWLQKSAILTPDVNSENQSRYTWNILSFIRKVPFVKKEWWLEDSQGKRCFYCRFDRDAPNGTKEKERYMEALEVFKNHFRSISDDFDESLFKYYFELGHDLIPLSTKHILTSKKTNFLRSPTTLKECLKKKGIINPYDNHLTFNKQIRNLYYYLKAQKILPYYNIDSVGYLPVVIDKDLCPFLSNGDYMAFYLASQKRAKCISYKMKREIFINHNYRVLNYQNNCFTTQKYINPQMKAIYDVFQLLFDKQDEAWSVYGKFEDIEILANQFVAKFYRDSVKQDFDVNYRVKNPYIEFDHEPSKYIIKNNASEGFPHNNISLIHPFFNIDHTKASRYEAGRKLEFWFAEKWLSKKRIEEFAFCTLENIKLIQKTCDVSDKLSKYIKKDYKHFLE